MTSKTEASQRGDAGTPEDAAEAEHTPGESPSKPPTEPGDPNGAPSPLIKSGKLAYGLAFLSGFLYFVAFPGVDVWPLAFVALIPLYIALRGQTPRRAAGLGWMAGFTMTMFGFYWLLGMLKTFSGFPTAVCLLFMAILCAYQAGRIALMGWLYGRAERRGWPAAPVFALAFATSELVYPLLFPWYYAATVHQVPLLTQTAEIGSPILVAWVLIAANIALAEPLLAKLESRPLRPKVVGGLSAAVVIAIAFGAVRIHQVDAAVAAAPSGKVGIVQANMSLMGKRRNKAEGLRRHLALTRQLEAKDKLDLVVWSETSVVNAMDEAYAPTWYRMNVTRRLKSPAIFGGVMIRKVPDSRKYVLFNSALASELGGEIKGRYDKQYLLAFGEYLPFGETFPKLHELSPHSGRFTPGKTVDPLPLGDRNVAVFICYEDIIPAFANSIMRSAESELMVNITNDAWFGDTTEPWIHLALAKFRSIEHRRFLVRSTNSGVSAFVDPVGRVTAHSGTFKQEALAETIHYMKGRTAYEVLGDAPWWLAALITFGMAWIRRPGPSGATTDSNS